MLKRKNELESLRDQLVGQYEKLVEQKRQFDNWMECRQEESQQQASMLVARERELSQRQTHFEEQAERWQVERMRYEQEIRRLRLKFSERTEHPRILEGLFHKSFRAKHSPQFLRGGCIFITSE